MAGPILLAYALAHGSGFAADAAAGTLLGLVSLIAFVVVYARLPAALLGRQHDRRLAGLRDGHRVLQRAERPCPAASRSHSPPWQQGSRRPRAAAPGAAHEQRAAWDLPLRAACALLLVLTLTAIAGWLGPQLSGLLAPFPIIATVLATFTHAQRGVDETLRLLRGLTRASAPSPCSASRCRLAEVARHRRRVPARDGGRAAHPGLVLR